MGLSGQSGDANVLYSRSIQLLDFFSTAIWRRSFSSYELKLSLFYRKCNNDVGDSCFVSKSRQQHEMNENDPESIQMICHFRSVIFYFNFGDKRLWDSWTATIDKENICFVFITSSLNDEIFPPTTWHSGDFIFNFIIEFTSNANFFWCFVIGQIFCPVKISLIWLWKWIQSLTVKELHGPSFRTERERTIRERPNVKWLNPAFGAAYS